MLATVTIIWKLFTLFTTLVLAGMVVEGYELPKWIIIMLLFNLALDVLIELAKTN